MELHTIFNCHCCFNAEALIELGLYERKQILSKNLKNHKRNKNSTSNYSYFLKKKELLFTYFFLSSKANFYLEGEGSPGWVLSPGHDGHVAPLHREAVRQGEQGDRGGVGAARVQLGEPSVSTNKCQELQKSYRKANCSFRRAT